MVRLIYLFSKQMLRVGEQGQPASSIPGANGIKGLRQGPKKDLITLLTVGFELMTFQIQIPKPSKLSLFVPCLKERRQSKMRTKGLPYSETY